MTIPDHARCTTCGTRMFPILPSLPCGHDDVPAVEPLTEPGTVYSWTRVHGGETSAVMAMVDFFGGELRVSGPFVGAEDLTIGDRLCLVTATATPYAFRRPS